MASDLISAMTRLAQERVEESEFRSRLIASLDRIAELFDQQNKLIAEQMQRQAHWISAVHEDQRF